MIFALQCLGVFALLVVVDIAWATYVKSAADGKPVRAAIAAGALYVMGAIVTMSYVNDHRFLVPAVAGSIVGTYIGVKRGGK